jgi:hypothetical protein
VVARWWMKKRRECHCVTARVSVCHSLRTDPFFLLDSILTVIQLVDV